MRYQEIIKTKQRAIRLLWTLSILILGLVLSGWLSPVGAQVTLVEILYLQFTIVSIDYEGIGRVILTRSYILVRKIQRLT